MAAQLVQAMADMQEQDALRLVKEALAAGEDPLQILGSARQAMDIVGQRFEAGQYFLPELIMAGEMLNQITGLVKPELGKSPQAESQGTVILGSVEGDIHDIGKNIVSFMLDVNGFEVRDLGVDVSPQAFVDAIRETGAGVVGLSGFLTLAFDAMKDTVSAIEEAGLREVVKIMIGGGQITELIRDYTGADAYGDDAMEAVGLAKQWMGG